VKGAAFAFSESRSFPNRPFPSFIRISVIIGEQQIESSYISFLDSAAQTILCRVNLSFKFPIDMNFL